MIQAGPHGARALNVTSPTGFAELIERPAVPAALAGPDPQLDLDRFMAVTTELGDVVLAGASRRCRNASGPGRCHVGADTLSSSDESCTASADGAIRLWETLETYSVSQPLRISDTGATPTASSPNGRLLAASHGNSVELWHTDTGLPGPALVGGENSVSAVAFSPDNRLIAAGNFDGSVRLWDTSTSQLDGEPFDSGGIVNDVAFSSDGTQLAVGSGDVTILDLSARETMPEP
jgi:WD40 repeat protein